MHDSIVASTSHLPHLVASTLAATVCDVEECLPLVGSGWRDTTRIASGDPELWRQILLANRGPTLKALADFEADLHQHIHLENNVLFPRAVALESRFSQPHPQSLAQLK